MEKGTINITGDIGLCGIDPKTKKKIIGVQLIDVIKQVASQPNATHFDVYIDSGGGEVYSGFEIYRYLVNLPQTITTYGKNMVASIATVIFMAGSERFLESGTKFMIHLPSGGAGGTAKEIEEYLAKLQEVQDLLIDFYTEVLQIDEESIYALLNSETWLTDIDCVELGIAKQLAEKTEKPLIVARVNKSDEKLNFM